MKSYGPNFQRRQIREAVRGEILKQAEHYDLCVLLTLHEDFGLDAEELRSFYRKFNETYRSFKDHYFDKDDERIFGERGDTYEMREALKKIGFDYDEEVKRMLEEKNGN